MGDFYHVSHAIYCRMKEDRDEDEVLEPFQRRSLSLHSKDYHNIPLTSILGDIESFSSILHTNLRSLGVIRASHNQFPPTLVSKVFSRYGM